jgi:chromosome segregation ATPase
MERERREMTGDIERLETELETAKVETVKVTEILKAERQARAQAEHQTQELRVENARFEEKASSVKVRADELHAQVEQLQGQLAELAKDRKFIEG